MNNTFVLYLHQQNNTKMNSQEIKNLANELTDKQVDNVIFGWTEAGEKSSISLFNSLVKLGESRQMACATVMIKKCDQVNDSEMYKFAYGN